MTKEQQKEVAGPSEIRWDIGFNTWKQDGAQGTPELGRTLKTESASEKLVTV